MAKLAAEGHRVVLVTATGGELGALATARLLGQCFGELFEAFLDFVERRLQIPHLRVQSGVLGAVTLLLRPQLSLDFLQLLAQLQLGLLVL